MDFKELNLYKAEYYDTSESGEREREPGDRMDQTKTKPTPFSHHQTRPD